tara:strand:- start:512 stop:946 length:435 start_codon:yes stop_codon:yes gene_type:complete
MVTFRNNNNRRPPFRNNNRRPSFRRDEGSKFSNNDNFQRKVPGRNNHNASKLIEKYNDLAREALANEDKILSENYFQHADHFMRVQNEQEKHRVSKINTTAPTETVNTLKSEETKEKEVSFEPASEKIVKSTDKKNLEKKSVAS